MGSAFSFARKEGFPTQHNEHKTSVTVDVLEAGLILAFLMLAFTFFLVIPGHRGKSKVYVLIRVTVSLLLGVIILIGNFGQEWEVGHIIAETAYKAGSGQEINASIGMKLGLRSVNITLKRIGNNDVFPGEIIDYNERFTWTWDQGRFGFGPYAGNLQQEFREAQVKGLPLPILWVADYFTWDGEGLRFGRHYRTAGWYAHIVLWVAFPCWLLANLLYLNIVRFGAYYTVLTGGLQLLACCLWYAIRNPEPLSIPFGDKEMITKFGVSFWLTFISGFICLIIGICIIVLDLRYPNELAEFFGTDPLADYEEYHLTPSELSCLRHKGKHTQEFDMVDMNDEHATQPNVPEMARTQVVLKRRTTVRRVQRSFIRAPVPAPREDEQPFYLNVQQPRFVPPMTNEEPGSSYNPKQRLYDAKRT